MKDEEKIKVIQAHIDGALIQYKEKFIARHSIKKWKDTSEDISWNFYRIDYRIKPIPREFYTNIYNSGKHGSLYATIEEAECVKESAVNFKTIKLIEVLED